MGGLGSSPGTDTCCFSGQDTLIVPLSTQLGTGELTAKGNPAMD